MCVLLLVGRLDTINRFNHTSWMAVVTSTGRHKSVRNRCVIAVLVALLCCQLVVQFCVDIGAFVIGLSQISFFFFSTLK